MGGLRTSLLQSRSLAMALVLLALCMKALVPAGFMIEANTTSLTVLVCADSVGAQSAMQIAIPHTSKKDGAPTKSHEACAFSVLGLASTSAVSPIELALALAFILLLGIIATPRVHPVALRRLLPPPCGPPAFI